MTSQKLNLMPGHLIRRAQQIAVSIFLAECASLDMTPVQYAALVTIGENTGIDATRLSALIAFDRSTLGNVLERLESKRLIRRLSDGKDRRVKVLQLTTEGEAILAQAAPFVESAQHRILAPLSCEDRRSFMTMLMQLVEANNEASRVPLRLQESG
ncbi:MarR family winged helix-turn-helix transcriptional regulator [Bosea sp. 47.2.35]|jgi:DNA-binding MarR family transcriptional regulator|uniref:MarR family winged helix-turn-helix transcriptional regulator n=1 Tax=Bosea sp. 47.2.35 TaxID=2969304 RepID=UPI00215024E0|nr:MarR family transcriptional regulator [Bosea sp. 47.2.35]MCR4524174.1 MarR family transcriptional regulator [Bosea sp. 47.2.35]